ncbi:protein of unknown function [Streptomyces indicus]|uniref:DUF4253 domain-containing protein n=2 Tax=Streptomyces indicus TaxID=417292 RepID=A0A1G8TAK0_9ACTN|nr:protein of unknown function [Streptomyces indicus]
MPVWVSDEFPDDVGQLWSRLRYGQASSGLVPLLVRPDVIGSPLGLDRVDSVCLHEVLPAAFAAYRRARLPFWTAPRTVPTPDDVEPWPHDPGPPYAKWPGFAPAVQSESPATAPASQAAALLDEVTGPEPAYRLALVRARRAADALAALGWTADAPLALLCALLRSWEERFGAQLVAVSGSEVHLAVARPPVSAEHARLLAVEHVLTTAHNIVDDPPTPFPEYAERLVGRTHWSFWWD